MGLMPLTLLLLYLSARYTSQRRDSVAGTAKASRCPFIPYVLMQEVRAILSFLTSSDLPTAQRALQPQCRAAGLPPPTSLADAARLAVNAADSKGKQGGGRGAR